MNIVRIFIKLSKVSRTSSKFVFVFVQMHQSVFNPPNFWPDCKCASAHNGFGCQQQQQQQQLGLQIEPTHLSINSSVSLTLAPSLSTREKAKISRKSQKSRTLGEAPSQHTRHEQECRTQTHLHRLRRAKRRRRRRSTRRSTRTARRRRRRRQGARMAFEAFIDWTLANGTSPAQEKKRKIQDFYSFPNVELGRCVALALAPRRRSPR